MSAFGSQASVVIARVLNKNAEFAEQQNFDSDLIGGWHYNHVTFTPIAKFFLLYRRLIYMLYILCATLTIKVKVGIPESFNVGWYHQKITGSSHLK